MNGICPLYDFNTYIKFIGVVSLIMILIITALYYTYIYHCSILEKYEEGKINPTTLKSTHGESGNRSTFPKNKYPGINMQQISSTENINDKYKLRDCKVYFVKDEQDKIKKCDDQEGDKKTCSYTFKDWQEFDTYTDKYGSNIIYPKKIYTHDYTNTDQLVNSYFTSKCFKKFDYEGKGQSQSFEFKENDLVKFDSKGAKRNTEVDTNIFNGLRYTSIQFLNGNNANDNFQRVIQSICEIKYNPIPKLANKKFYKFEFDGNNNFRNITKVAINADQTGFTSIAPADALEDFASYVSHGLNCDSTNAASPLKIFIKPEITIVANIYIFNYVSYLCENTQIKNYSTVRQLINGSAMMSFSENNSSTSVNFALADVNMNYLDKAKYSSKVVNNGNNTVRVDYRVDHKADITYDLEQKIEALEKVMIDESDKEIKKKESDIKGKEVDIQKGIDNQSNFGEKDTKTFSEIMNLKKKDRISRIFNYQYGAHISQRSQIGIPIGAKIIYVNTNEICMIFNNNNNSNNGQDATYNFSIPSGSTYTCDILIVGGGGGGGQFGGGGGGGEVILGRDKKLSGNTTIKVGAGGGGIYPYGGGNGNNGNQSYIAFNNQNITAKGGGGGGTRRWYGDGDWHGRSGNDGGSGGGGSHSNNRNTQGKGGKYNKSSYSGWESYGNNGGEGRPGFPTWHNPNHASGGGGGAGGVGGSYDLNIGGGNGGKGINLEGHFGTTVGHNGYFAGGGGGNTYWGAGNKGYGNGGDGLLGGGGDGGFDGHREFTAVNGLANTGGGGGGGKWDGGSSKDIRGGNGGSGVVIIKIKNIVLNSIRESIVERDYKQMPSYWMYLQPTRLENNVVSGFIFLQAGYYRFKANIDVVYTYNPTNDNQWRNNNDAMSSNTIYSELMIFDESNYERNTSSYNGRIVFKHNLYNGQYKPSYLKQYVYIPTSKFYRIAYRCTTYNNTHVHMLARFMMFYNYLSKAPTSLENTIPPQLMAWFKFNGDSRDSTTNNYRLIDNGGNRYLNDGRKSYINTADGSLKATSISLSNKSFSISVWLRFRSNNGGWFVLQGSAHGTNIYLHIGAREDNAYCLAFYANDLEAGASGNPGSYPDDVNNWVHLVYVVEKNVNQSYNRKIYRNGTLISKDENKGAFQGWGDLRIGNNMNIDISDFLLFNRAVSKEDVESLYSTVLSSSTPTFTETYISLANNVSDEKNNDPNLFTTFNMSMINSSLENNYLFCGDINYEHYNDKKFIKIFNTIKYTDNNSLNYQVLVNYLDTGSSKDYNGRITPIDFFKIASLRNEINDLKQAIKKITDELSGKIDKDPTIIGVRKLLRAINNIDYNTKLPIKTPTRISANIAAIFTQNYAEFLTSEKITNTQTISNVLNAPLSKSIYIEAFK